MRACSPSKVGVELRVFAVVPYCKHLVIRQTLVYAAPIKMPTASTMAPPSETETVNRGDVARPVIRIASDRVGPPRVEIDTRSPAAAIPASIPDIVKAPAQVAEARPGSSTPTPAVAIKV